MPDTYKFVRREMLIAFGKMKTPRELGLFDMAERLFAERETYRHLAILFHAKQLTIRRSGGTVESDFVDAEAQRILGRKE
jgi:hypothetical protein